MDYKTAYAECADADSVRNARKAVQKIRQDIGDFPAHAILFFASPIKYDPETIAREFKHAFPNAKTFGCSSSGEGVGNKMLRQSVVCMAFSSRVFDVLEITAVENIDFNPNAVDNAFGRLGQRLGEPVRDLDYRSHVGFILMDGLSSVMEKIMDRIGEATDVIFTGGCAGDDMLFKKTYVYNDGIAYGNGAVIAIMKPAVPFGIIKTESLTPTKTVLTATDVDNEHCLIRKFDNIPAVRAYAEAIGIPEDKLSPEYFSSYPLALMAGDEPFVRNALSVHPGGVLQLATRPIVGMRYTVSKARDIVNDTKIAIVNKEKEIGKISALIGVHCLYRDLQARREGTLEKYGALFSDMKHVGFSSYAEIYIGIVNQTSTMLAFH